MSFQVISCPLCGRKVLNFDLESHISQAHLILHNNDKIKQFSDCRLQLLADLRMFCVNRTNLFALRSQVDESSESKRHIDVTQSLSIISPVLPEPTAGTSSPWKTEEENACATDRNASGEDSTSIIPDISDDDEYADEWCTCKRWKQEKMIACDGTPDCPFEWFHYSCVGIRRAPKGKWYCSVCRERMKIDETIEETIQKASSIDAVLGDEVEVDESMSAATVPKMRK